MAYIKKEGGKRFGAAGSKPSFAKKSWGGKSDAGSITHHKATCTSCGESCEVPFRPVTGKPIFCRNCFVKTGDTAAGRAGDRYPKREYQARSYASPAPEIGKSDDVLRQLEMMNAKLERLIKVVEASASRK